MESLDVWRTRSSLRRLARALAHGEIAGVPKGERHGEQRLVGVGVVPTTFGIDGFVKESVQFPPFQMEVAQDVADFLEWSDHRVLRQGATGLSQPTHTHRVSHSSGKL